MDMLSDASLAHAFAAQAASHPDRPALCEEGRRTWSYRQLDAHAGAVAGELADRGVTGPSRVAVLGGRTARTVVAILGVLRAGAAYCVIDPASPPARRQLLVQDLSPAAVVLTEPGDTAWAGADCPVVRLPATVTVTDGHRDGAPVGDPSALAYVMYTSGSTGRPKGVMVEHGSVLNMLRSYEALAPARDGFSGTLVAPTAFDVSGWEMFSVLAYGGTLHVPRRRRLDDGEQLWDFLRTAAIESAYLPPGLLLPVVEAAERRGGGALRRVLVGVEPIAQGLLERLRTACPGLRVVNGYGPTETTITATLHLMGAPGDPDRRTPVGRAVLGSQVEVVDEHLRAVPAGEVGEILVSGACLARGYLDRSAGGFVDRRRGRAYRTGDYGRFAPDGALEFVGRRDGQVKVNGFRVETGEVEAVLGTAPGVRRSVVLVEGEADGRRLVAAVEAPSPVGPADIRGHLAARLPHHAVPSRIIVMPAFPLTDNGKIDTRALLAAGRERPADAAPYVPPRSAWQREVAGAWARVLGIAPIGLDDDLHQLGGTSLDAVRIAGRLRQAGHAVSAADVLDARTVRGLATCAPPAERTAVRQPAEPGSYPANRSQEGLWAWRELHPDQAGTTVVHAIGLDGAVDPARMHQAMCAVVRRHEALRTTFDLTADHRLEQRVARFDECELPVRQVSSPEEVDRHVERLLAHRFDVRVRPWTARLLVGDGFGALVFAADHLVFDGESAGVLQRDLARAYDDPQAGATPVAGPASVASLMAPSPERARRLGDHWAHALEGFVDSPVLAEPFEPTAGGQRRWRSHLDPDLWQVVAALARSTATTPFVVVLAAFKAFLRQRGSGSDNTVAVAVSRRPAVDCTEAVGHFVNLVPVRDRVSPDRTASLRFSGYVAEVASLFRQGMAHSDLPFEDVITYLDPSRAADVAGPARVVLVQQVHTDPSLTAAGLRLRPWPRLPSNAIYDLAVLLSEATAGEPAALEWLWDAGATLDGSVEDMAEAFVRFLRAGLARPTTALAELPALCAAEARLVDSAATPQGGPDPDDPHTLVSLFADQVAGRPDATAVHDGPDLVSYQQLDRRASAIADALGVANGRRPVAVVLDKSVDLLAAMVAVLRTGAPYLPLAPEHAPTRLYDLVRRAGTGVCVTNSRVAAGLALPEQTRLVLVDQLPAARAGAAQPTRPTRPTQPTRPTDLAYLMPTSGSTGAPKLVGVPHRAVVRLVRANTSLPLNHTDRTMLVANSSFDAATFEIWGALANGGRVVVPTADQLREPGLLCSALAAHGITAGFFTTTLFERLVEAAPQQLAGMRHVIVGGEVVPPRLFARAAAFLPAGVLVNGYGPTENTTFSCCFRLDRDPRPLRSLPIGGPICGSGVLVVDQSLRPLPPGVPGEILVTGAGLAQGYIDDPELTARRFVRLETLGGTRAYRTGDLGRLLRDGTVEYLGRLDRQIKIRGFRVEPAEVETALAAHPLVRRAVAYAEDVGGIRTLLAVVEAVAGAPPAQGAALRAWLADRLPDYLLPARIRVVDRLPMTANGKLDRAALRDAEATSRRLGVEEGYTEVQRVIAGVCTQLLPTSAVGLDDDIFELGANSLTILALVARLGDLGMAVPSHLVYSAPTVRSLSARIQAGSGAADQELASRVRKRAQRIRVRSPR